MRKRLQALFWGHPDVVNGEVRQYLGPVIIAKGFLADRLAQKRGWQVFHICGFPSGAREHPETVLRREASPI